MWLRISILSLIAMLSACSSLNVKENDISNLPPTATGGDGSITAEVWNNIGGRAVRNLTRHSTFPDDSSSEITYPAIDLVNSQLDKYGRRIVSILTVDIAGDYRFRISADDSAELWLATDASPENKRLLAFTNRPTGYKVWDRYKSQVSPVVSLEADTPYFMEVIHKDNTGEDYLVVEWSQNGGDYSVVTQDQLSAYVPSTGSSSGEIAEDPQRIHETAYHAGYAAGINLLAYDASYPLADQDNDGIPDFFEAIAGTNANDFSDAIGDLDGDGLTNYEEYLLLLDPNNADTDGDSIPDGFEVAYDLNPLDSGDGASDADGDGFTNAEEFLANTSPNDTSSVPVVVQPPVSEQEVLLTWQAPTAREDGSSLQTTEIASYKVYSGSSANSLTAFTDIDDPEQLSLSQTLSEGTYYYAISTVTVDGNESPISDVISVTVN